MQQRNGWRAIKHPVGAISPSSSWCSIKSRLRSNDSRQAPAIFSISAKSNWLLRFAEETHQDYFLPPPPVVVSHHHSLEMRSALRMKSKKKLHPHMNEVTVVGREGGKNPHFPKWNYSNGSWLGIFLASFKWPIDFCYFSSVLVFSLWNRRAWRVFPVHVDRSSYVNLTFLTSIHRQHFFHL